MKNRKIFGTTYPVSLFVLFALLASSLLVVSCGRTEKTEGYRQYDTPLAEELGLSEDETVWDYKDNYVPQQFKPLPEYMVFVDLGVLVLLLLAGLFFVLTRKPARHLTLLAIVAFVYLGIIRGGCICPVGAITNVTRGLVTPALVGLSTLVLFLFPLLLALIAGRIFCTSGCPLGAVQHLFYKKKKHYQLPPLVNKLIKIVPVVILLLTVYLALTSTCYFICKLEPYKALFFTGQAWIEQGIAFLGGHAMESRLLWAFGAGAWLYLIIVLVVGYWIPRPFCRLLCPYGVLLGAFSIFSLKKRSINKDACVYCKSCQKVCPMQAITIDREKKRAVVSAYDCVQCNRCNDSCPKQAVVNG